MGSRTLFKEPGGCDDAERRAFARLVRRGFDGSDDTTNVAMARILDALGFGRVGSPYPWRREQHALFLRPAPTN